MHRCTYIAIYIIYINAYIYIYKIEIYVENVYGYNIVDEIFKGGSCSMHFTGILCKNYVYIIQYTKFCKLWMEFLLESCVERYWRCSWWHLLNDNRLKWSIFWGSNSGEKWLPLGIRTVGILCSSIRVRRFSGTCRRRGCTAPWQYILYKNTNSIQLISK